MSVKKFIRDRIEKRELVDDLKRAVIQGSNGRVRGFEKIDASSSVGVLDLLISVGNMAYTSGEIDVFEYFIGSLFEVVNSDADVDAEELLENILHFGTMSTYGHDIYTYSIILENFVEYIFELEEMEAIDSNLRNLKRMALEAERKGFDSGVLQVAAALRDMADHLQKENMLLSRFFLKNHLISLIYTIDRRGKADLREDIIKETRDILEYAGVSPNKADSSINKSPQGPDAPSEQVA